MRGCWTLPLLAALAAGCGDKESAAPAGDGGGTDGAGPTDGTDGADDDGMDGTADGTDDGADGTADATDGTTPADADGDGFTVEEGDCDDTDDETFPGAEDHVANGVDNDCDGVPGVDGDGDGVASNASGGPDCDDTDPAIPGDDLSTDGVDDDCDGIDGPDADGDGFADAATGGSDCDDSEPRVNPDSSDYAFTDGDCDGAIAVGTADASVWGLSNFGSRLERAGDVDGDGRPDFVASDTRRAFVYSATQLTAGTTLDYRDAIHAISARWAGGAGSALAGVGDVDGDGLDDLLIGESTSQYTASTGSDYGWAALVTGATLATLGDVDVSTDADVLWVGGTGFGGSLGSMDDLDGDGLPELLFGNTSGAAALVFSSTWPTMESPASTSYYYSDAVFSGFYGSGTYPAGAGDVDGDGVADLLVGQPGFGRTSSPGKVHVWYGDTVLALSEESYSVGAADDSDVILTGESASDFAGKTLAAGPDIDGDGLSDMLLSARMQGTLSNEGSVYLFRAQDISSSRVSILLDEAWLRLDGSASGDWIGEDGISLGDVDGDGVVDALIGSSVSADGGRAWLWLGAELASTSGTLSVDETPYVWRSDDASSGRVGRGATIPGDIDGDGLDDLLITDLNSPTRSTGEVFLLLSPW